MYFSNNFYKDCKFSKVPSYAPDDGPNGPKDLGATQRDILSVSCNILCFNKECICWQKSFELIKMHGKTTIKISNVICHCVEIKRHEG
jgi:hypothetical protein